MSVQGRMPRGRDRSFFFFEINWTISLLLNWKTTGRTSPSLYFSPCSFVNSTRNPSVPISFSARIPLSPHTIPSCRSRWRWGKRNESGRIPVRRRARGWRRPRARMFPSPDSLTTSPAAHHQRPWWPAVSDIISGHGGRQWVEGRPVLFWLLYDVAGRAKIWDGQARVLLAPVWCGREGADLRFPGHRIRGSTPGSGSSLVRHGSYCSPCWSSLLNLSCLC